MTVEDRWPKKAWSLTGGGKNHEQDQGDYEPWILRFFGIDLGDPWIVIKWYLVMCILQFIDTYYIGVIGEIKHRIGQWYSGNMTLNSVHALDWLIRKDKNNKIKSDLKVCDDAH
jgi:hypothetical protein